MKKLFAGLTIVLLGAPLIVAAQVSWLPSSYTTGGVNTSNLPFQTNSKSGDLPPYQQLEPLPSAPGSGQTCTGSVCSPTLAGYLNNVYLMAVTVGSLIAVVMLVTSGIRLMLSEAFTDRDKAKKRITNAVWGLVLLIGSFTFLYTINPNLLNFQLNVPKTQQTSQYNWNTTSGGNASGPVVGPGGIPVTGHLGTDFSSQQRDAVAKAAGCSGGFFGCSLYFDTDAYIIYNTGSPDTQAINQFVNQCNTTLFGDKTTGYERRVPGDVVGATDQTILFCSTKQQ